MAWDLRRQVYQAGAGTGLVGLARVDFASGKEVICASYIAQRPWRVVVAQKTNSAAARTLFEVPFDVPTHLGGAISAADPGSLIVALGDGGAPYDPFANAQDRRRLPGSLLWLDLGHVGVHGPYGVPLTNPFIGRRSLRDEIWAYGFAVPVAPYFDAGSGRIWCLDLGAPGVAEVNAVRSGSNHGWNIMAGRRCVEPLPDCERGGLALPVFEVRHPSPDILIGGFVQRGNVGGRGGRYVFGDRRTGTLMAIDATQLAVPTTVAPERLASLPPDTAAIVPGGGGEIHALTSRGEVYRYQ